MATVRMWRYPEGVRTDRNLSGYEVEASDGSIGSIDEATKAVDEYWVIVDTGPWIFGKRVLLPAGLVERGDHVTSESSSTAAGRRSRTLPSTTCP
jgi:hypothetical protein